MKITYDPEADAMYIYLDEKANVDKTKEIEENMILDYDKDGHVIGIEFLFVKKRMPYLLEKVKTKNLQLN
ncbi:DUF2283 domain-containing protein [Candidatus Woesearchaeota archaeon]|nr:DUF2283 domain-containing protein [Candidatus Woesearchaeota archaeon]